jgi:hypothetical protein
METGWVAAGSVTVAALAPIATFGGTASPGPDAAALAAMYLLFVLRTIDAIRLGTATSTAQAPD